MYFGKKSGLKSYSKLYFLGFCLVVGGVFLAYSTALDGPLFFDDLPSITQNLILHIDGRNADGWRTAAYSSDAGPLHRPISMLSFAFNYAVSGVPSSISFKAVNLAIHLLISCLVYYFSLAVFRSPALSSFEPGRARLSALLSAAIWLLHPLHVSTVLYAVQRMTQLSALFSIVGLCVFMRYRLRWADIGATTGEVLALVLWLMLLTAAATLSKENGALLPWLLAVVEVSLFQGQWQGARSRNLWVAGRVAVMLPLLLLLLILLQSPEIFTSGYKLREFSMAERLLTQSRILWHYISWIIFPDISAMGFHHDDIPLSSGLMRPWTTLASVAGWIAMTVLACRLRHRYPLLLFALLFFLVGQVMESSVLALEMVFEHRNYLPSVGICILLASVLSRETFFGTKLSSWIPLGVIVGILFVLLFIRTQVWAGHLSLASANVVNHPDSPRAHYFYADSLLEKHTARLSAGHTSSAQDLQENKALIVNARKHFLIMHELMPNSAIAIAKLLYLDSYFFPGLINQLNWYEQLRDVLRKSALQASDLSALSLLVNCVGDGGCSVSTGELGNFLDEMILRSPGEVWLKLSKYKLLLNASVSPNLRIVPLQKAARVAPNNPSVQQNLVKEKAALGDVTGMYEVVRNWLYHDPNRWSLPAITPLFSAQPHSTVQEVSSQRVQRD